ncbi:hypothetical protein RSAG8_10782, partial [Rhizoctonia solani AG-8 WAC10335]
MIRSRILWIKSSVTHPLPSAHSPLEIAPANSR